MTYTRKGDEVILQMSVDDYQKLLLILGNAAGAAFHDKPRFWHYIDFANRLNAGNPNFIPYEIPEEYR